MVTTIDMLKGLQDFVESSKKISKVISQNSSDWVVKPLVPSPAESAYDRLQEYFVEFESQLDDEHEIGVKLVGSLITFHILKMGYCGTDIITFHGTDDKGQAVQLIQNISQLNVYLVALKKIGQKPRRIGFNSENRN